MIPLSPRILKTGEELLDSRVDRIEEFDARSDDFPVAPMLKPVHLAQPRSFTWSLHHTLTQDKGDGGCVGFAWTHELIARPREVPGLDATFAREQVYWQAQRIDQWPGGDYPEADPLMAGTSVLAGAKVLHALGYFDEYRWAQSVLEMVAVLGYLGPCVFGTRWYEGMHTPDQDHFMHPTGRRRNGHCLLANGVKVIKDEGGSVDFDRSFVRFQNSFGPSWGTNGQCYMTLTDIASLWEHAEVCVPFKRRKKPAQMV
jgi:hypothetical protein